MPSWTPGKRESPILDVCRVCGGDGIVPVSKEPCSTDLMECRTCSGTGRTGQGTGGEVMDEHDAIAKAWAELTGGDSYDLANVHEKRLFAAGYRAAVADMAAKVADLEAEIANLREWRRRAIERWPTSRGSIVTTRGFFNDKGVNKEMHVDSFLFLGDHAAQEGTDGPSI